LYKVIKARVSRVTKEGTLFHALVPNESLTDELRLYSDNGLFNGELRIDDGRTIRAKQRKKAWATIGDISLWNGDDRETNHWWLKIMYMTASGESKFSLSNCTVTTARHYISFLLDFCLEWNVPLSEPIINRTDDIDAMIYATIKHKRCIVCGAEGEIHHWDAIGMGRNRNTYDDSGHRKLCLCRFHHNEAHNIGVKAFEEKHHVYGIIYKE